MDSERASMTMSAPPRDGTSACPRPAAPFALSMLMAAKAPAAAPSAGKFVLPNVVLRKVSPQPIFANFDESAYLIKPPTQMMRFLDALRYHKPTDDERNELNISSSTERLHLHALNDILIICGARKGFRFNSQDINAFRSLSEQLERQFNVLDQLFRALPLDVTRFKFSDVKRIEDDAAFLRLASLQCASTTSSTLAPLERSPGGDDATRWHALVFQWHARTYIDVFARLRATVVNTRERLRLAFSSRKPLLETKDLSDAVEAEFEAKVHHPFPTFLFVLMQKYHREYREEDMAWTPESTEPPVDSIAQFALFLSDLLVHRGSFTAREMRSMEVMLQVLKVTYRVDYELLTLELVGVWRGSSAQCETTQTTASGAPTHATLSSLLYDFLATVRELRLVPRQKELLLPHTKPRRSRRQHANATNCAPLRRNAQRHPSR